MTITALPTPPSRDDPTTFAALGDAFLGALPTFATEANATAATVNADAAAADASKIAAAASAAASASSAGDAAASVASAYAVSGISKWVSGTTYAQGDCTWSPINYQTYRRKSAGGGTIDPSIDYALWERLAASVPDFILQAQGVY